VASVKVALAVQILFCSDSWTLAVAGSSANTTKKLHGPFQMTRPSVLALHNGLFGRLSGKLNMLRVHLLLLLLVIAEKSNKCSAYTVIRSRTSRKTRKRLPFHPFVHQRSYVPASQQPGQGQCLDRAYRRFPCSSAALMSSIFTSVAEDDHQYHRKSEGKPKLDTSSQHKTKEDKLDLRLLLIDHYDSFTYNLVDLLAQICVHPPIVVAADVATSWEGLEKHLQLLLSTTSEDTPFQNYQQGELTSLVDLLDGIVLSPGPGRPDQAPLSLDIVRKAPSNLPILGVCLGHQILGHVYGANVTLAPNPIHGQVQAIRRVNGEENDEDPLWKNIPHFINVTRYHSLQVLLDYNKESPLLIPTALAENDNVVMGLRHHLLPHFGVQFHPESIGSSTWGPELLRNFCNLCVARQDSNTTTTQATRQMTWNTSGILDSQENTVSPLPVLKELTQATISTRTGSIHTTTRSPPRVFLHRIEYTEMEPEILMQTYLVNEPYNFWLDSANAETNKSSSQQTMYSILGAAKTRVEYYGKEKNDRRGIYVFEEEALKLHLPDTDVLTYLEQYHNPRRLTEGATILSFEKKCADERGCITKLFVPETELSQQVGFGFRGGHVGYLGYETRHDTTSYLEAYEGGGTAPTRKEKSRLSSSTDPHVPTAAFLWADRSYVYNHRNREWYLVGVAETSDDESAVLVWMKRTSQLLRRSFKKPLSSDSRLYQQLGNLRYTQPVMCKPNRSRGKYDRNFDSCIEYIRQGDSYELCLTNQLEADVPKQNPFELYQILRRHNPAPYSAFFHWNIGNQGNTNTPSAFAICCSSPERFVSVKPDGIVPDGNKNNKRLVEAKPIKGTCARVIPAQYGQWTEQEKRDDLMRVEALRSSLKDRAENLMIVDLLRNDLSRVCETGSVHVAKLMEIESYASVHQMVSTIRGVIDSSNRSCVDVLKSSFPGGSMTGAPKLRTMELLDEIEEGVGRGPYSGCLGYISLNGDMDMNIIIRSAVLTPSSDKVSWKVRVGAGGAITALSERASEYDEMLLKASAVTKAVEVWARAGPADSDYPQTLTSTFKNPLQIRV
jgi:para-aminobenzoate synthetase